MYLIRDIFQAKPGKTKELVATFKKTIPFMESAGFSNIKIMTDVVFNYWTVVLQSEVESLAIFENSGKYMSSKPEIGEIMKNYMDNMTGGHREIFRIE